ncbi:MAG: ABC transporter substrate-binding protein [Thermodesulfobacteriota bacterium]
MKKRSLRLFLALLFLALPLLVPGSALSAEAVSGPEKTVSGLHSVLISVMKDAKKLGFRGRYDVLDPEIRERFDLAFITRFAAGRYWRRLTEEQKRELTERFSVMSVATYASRFDGYSGEEFRHIGVEEAKRGRVIVRTVLVKSDGETFDFVYVLRRTGDGWRIINVVVDGVSDLSLKRSQFTAILKKKGIDGLMKKIDKKIRDYETGAAD